MFTNLPAPLVIFCLGLAAIAVYLLPSAIASERRHRERAAIFVLNLLLGWTFLGWVAALVWSLTSHVEPPLPTLEERRAQRQATLDAKLAAAGISPADFASVVAWAESFGAELHGLQLDLAARGRYLTVAELSARYNPSDQASLGTVRAARADVGRMRPLTRAQRWATATGWTGFRLRRHEDAVAIKRALRWLMARATAGRGVSPPRESDGEFAPSIPLEKLFDDPDVE